MNEQSRITEERMRTWPRHEQEYVYLSFYAAYLSAIENHDDQLERKYQQLLKRLQDLWHFSLADITVLEGRAAHNRANIREMINLLLGECDEPHSLH